MPARACDVTPAAHLEPTRSSNSTTPVVEPSTMSSTAAAAEKTSLSIEASGRASYRTLLTDMLTIFAGVAHSQPTRSIRRRGPTLQTEQTAGRLVGVVR